MEKERDLEKLPSYMIREDRWIFETEEEEMNENQSQYSDSSGFDFFFSI